MTESVDRQTAAERLRSADDILILCHKNPDGDTVGSAAAVYRALTALGKTAAVLCSDPIPAMYSYMKFKQFDGSFEPAFVLAVDVASIQLFGEKNNVQTYVEQTNLCIDHHGTNSGYAYATLVEDNAAAVCEILTEWIPENLGVPLDADIADCLYTGLSTDTGCFRFTNTTARTHKMAAILIEAGADLETLNEILFESRSHARVEAEKEALESMQFFFDDRCAMICLTWDQIRHAGVAGAELEDLTSLPRSVEGVQVGLTLRQQPDGSFKISVRTDRSMNASDIARRLGGGGHPRAAGCEISGNLENAKRAVLEEVQKALDRRDAEAAKA